MRVIIAGSRDITNYRDIKKLMETVTDQHYIRWGDINEVVSGAARGVDKLGEAWAAEYEIPVKQFPADWNQHGKSAGPIRNSEMAEYADALVAIWDGKSRGTQNMIETAMKHGLKLFVVTIT